MSLTEEIIDRPYPLNVKLLRRLLITIDDLVHVAVAVVLLVPARDAPSSKTVPAT